MTMLVQDSELYSDLASEGQRLSSTLTFDETARVFAETLYEAVSL
jgi:hypothetical protein